MSPVRRGSNSIFFAALYCSCLGNNALLALPTMKGCNKSIKSKKVAMMCCKENKTIVMKSGVDIDSCTFLSQHPPVEKCSGQHWPVENCSVVNGLRLDVDQCIFLGRLQAALFIKPLFLYFAKTSLL